MACETSSNSTLLLFMATNASIATRGSIAIAIVYVLRKFAFCI